MTWWQLPAQDGAGQAGSPEYRRMTNPRRKADKTGSRVAACSCHHRSGSPLALAWAQDAFARVLV